jgi:hypothetical protein
MDHLESNFIKIRTHWLSSEQQKFRKVHCDRINKLMSVFEMKFQNCFYSYNEALHDYFVIVNELNYLRCASKRDPRVYNFDSLYSTPYPYRM